MHLVLTFRCLYERLDLLDEVLDRVGGSLQLLLVAVQGVAEVGRVLEQKEGIEDDLPNNY